MQSSKEKQEEIKKPFQQSLQRNGRNNRMRMTRELFKKIGDTKGTFHAKMVSIKDRNGMDLTKQKILRRGGKNTQRTVQKKIFMTQMITMLSSLT